MRDPNARAVVELEAAALRAADNAGCAVPRIGEITVHDGRPALIMQRIDGPDLLTRLARRPWEVFEVGRLMGELHADLHGVTAPREVPLLKERLRSRIESAPVLS